MTAIEHEITGAGDKAVLYLHGLGGDQSVFAPQLLAHGDRWRNVSWSMPGHGATPALAETTFEGLAEAAVELLDDLEIARATLVGHSMGGMIAQQLAFDHPDRVDRLVLMATSGAFGRAGSRFNRTFVDERIEPLEAGAEPADLAEIAIDRLLAPGVDAGLLAVARAPLARVSADDYAAAVRCLDGFDATARLGRIEAPTLCIAGRLDAAASPEVMGRLADAVPRARLVVVDGAGHFPMLERAEIVDRHLIGFVGE